MSLRLSSFSPSGSASQSQAESGSESAPWPSAAHAVLEVANAARWSLRRGQAVTFRPPSAGVLRVLRGRAWVTFDVHRDDGVQQRGDHFVALGHDLALRAGQCLVLEAWPFAGQADVSVQWLPQPASQGASHWQAAVVQPVHDIGSGLALVLRACLRLLRGVASYGLLLCAGRGRVLHGLESNAP